MFWQVLNTLHLLEKRKIDRIPVAIFGHGSIYFHENGHEDRRSVWEYYFEPLVAEYSENHVLTTLDGSAFELLESKRRQLELARGAIEFPHDLHLMTPLTAKDQLNLARIDELISTSDWAWTEAFYPIVDHKKSFHIDIPPNDAGNLVRRYIRPRPHIQRKVSKLFQERLQGYYIIGVHVRGTDGHGAPARGVEIPFDRYFSEIEQRIAKVGKHACRVLLATDEQNVISLFEERFGKKLVYYQAQRKTDGDEVFGVGPTGQVMPGYLSKGENTAVQNGDDAVVEYALLCKSDFFIHNLSSLSSAVRLSVPESISL